MSNVGRLVSQALVFLQCGGLACLPQAGRRFFGFHIATKLNSSANRAKARVIQEPSDGGWFSDSGEDQPDFR